MTSNILLPFRSQDRHSSAKGQVEPDRKMKIQLCLRRILGVCPQSKGSCARKRLTLSEKNASGHLKASVSPTPRPSRMRSGCENGTLGTNETYKTFARKSIRSQEITETSDSILMHQPTPVLTRVP